MAEKVERTIHSAVRADKTEEFESGRISHASKLYGPGMEDELANDASPEQIQYLTDQGAISGYATPKKGSPAAEAAAPEREKAEAPKAEAPKAPAPKA